jgi:hypothetical protein
MPESNPTVFIRFMDGSSRIAKLAPADWQNFGMVVSVLTEDEMYNVEFIPYHNIRYMRAQVQL